MRKLLIPEPSENCIDLSEITPGFNGLILASKDENIIGTIMYDDNSEEWLYTECVHINDPIYSNESLLNVIKAVIRNSPNIQFYTTK